MTYWQMWYQGYKKKTTPIKEIHAYKEPVLLNGLSTCRNFKQWNSFWTENLGIPYLLSYFSVNTVVPFLKIILEEWSETQERRVIDGLKQYMCKNCWKLKVLFILAGNRCNFKLLRICVWKKKKRKILVTDVWCVNVECFTEFLQFQSESLLNWCEKYVVHLKISCFCYWVHKYVVMIYNAVMCFVCQADCCLIVVKNVCLYSATGL